jgi:hypothetical protein
MTLLLGCATAQIKPSVTDDMFTSDYPKLMVQIHKDVLKKGKEKNSWYWQIGNGEGIAVNVARETHYNVDYYYSLEKILTNIKYIPLDPVFINDHKWMKYAFVNENDFLHTGYFTRKDKFFIFVLRYLKLGEKYMKEARQFGKTRVMSDEQKLLLKEAFKYTDRSFTIKY